MLKRFAALLLAATMIFGALPLEAAMFSEPVTFGLPVPDSIAQPEAADGIQPLVSPSECDHSEKYCTYTKTSEYHYYLCPTCGEFTKEEHTFDKYACTVCFYTPDHYIGLLNVSYEIPLGSLSSLADSEHYAVLTYPLGELSPQVLEYGHISTTIKGRSYEFPRMSFSYPEILEAKISFGDSAHEFDGTETTLPLPTDSSTYETLTINCRFMVSDIREAVSIASEAEQRALCEQIKNSLSIRFYTADGESVPNSEVSGSSFRSSRFIPLRCNQPHRFSNGVCTDCGCVMPRYSNINISDLLGLSSSEMSDRVFEWFGENSSAYYTYASDGSERYNVTVKNLEYPYDQMHLSVTVVDDIVFQITKGAYFGKATSSPYWNGVEFVDGVPFTATVAQLDALAASGKLIRGEYDIQQEGFPKGAKQISYSLSKMVNDIDSISVSWNMENFIYTSDGYELIPDEDLAKAVPAFPTARYLPYSKIPDFSGSSLNVLGLSKDEAVSALSAAFPGTTIMYSGNATIGTINVVKYNMPLAAVGIVNGRAEYISALNNTAIRNKIPNVIEGFNSKVTRSVLQAMHDSDPSSYFFSTKTDSLVAGGIQEVYAFTKGDVIIVYGYINYTYSIENGKLSYKIDNTAVPFINEVRLVPKDYSNVYVADLIDTPAEEVIEKLNAMFNIDPSFGLSVWWSVNRYPYNVQVQTRDFAVSVGYEDKVEGIGFVSSNSSLSTAGYYVNAYPAGVSIPAVYDNLPKITKDLPYILDRDQLKSVLSSSGYKYTVSEVGYVDYVASLGQSIAGSEEIKDIDKLKMNVYTVDIGNAFAKFAYPNGYIAYDIGVNGNIMVATNRHAVLYNSTEAVSIVSCIIETKEPTVLIPYAVTGGYIYIDPVTGEIVKADAGVTEAVIPKEVDGVAVTGIGENAFSDTRLESIDIPTSVTSIASSAFSNCPYLEKIKYQGTEEMWEKLVGDDLDISDTVIVECRNFELGDINGDGKVNVQDGVLMQRILANLEKNPDYVARANLNGDSRIDIQDGVKMQRILAHLD